MHESLDKTNLFNKPLVYISCCRRVFKLKKTNYLSLFDNFIKRLIRCLSSKFKDNLKMYFLFNADKLNLRRNLNRNRKTPVL